MFHRKMVNSFRLTFDGKKAPAYFAAGSVSEKSNWTVLTLGACTIKHFTAVFTSGTLITPIKIYGRGRMVLTRESFLNKKAQYI
jgi:hypothetical protein